MCSSNKEVTKHSMEWNVSEISSMGMRNGRWITSQWEYQGPPTEQVPPDSTRGEQDLEQDPPPSAERISSHPQYLHLSSSQAGMRWDPGPTGPPRIPTGRGCIPHLQSEWCCPTSPKGRMTASECTEQYPEQVYTSLTFSSVIIINTPLFH